MIWSLNKTMSEPFTNINNIQNTFHSTQNIVYAFKF